MKPLRRTELMTKEIQESVQLEMIRQRIGKTLGWLESVKRHVALNSLVVREKGVLTKTLDGCSRQFRLLDMQLGFSTHKLEPLKPEESPICDAEWPDVIGSDVRGKAVKTVQDALEAIQTPPRRKNAP